MRETRIFLAQIDLLHPVLDWVRGALADMGCAGSAVRHIELAVEEVFVNIVRHAYADRPGDVEIDLRATSQEAVTFAITFKDQGPPFNPLESPSGPIDSSLAIEDMEEGGLGLLFIRHYVDDVTYQRQGIYNKLILTKKIYPNDSTVGASRSPPPKD